jgi:WD40 repeat protein
MPLDRLSAALRFTQFCLLQPVMLASPRVTTRVSLAASESRKYVTEAVTGSTKQVCQWVREVRRALRRGHVDTVKLVFAAGNYLYSTSADGTVRKWDLEKADCTQVLRAKDQGEVSTATLANGCTVVTLLFHCCHTVVTLLSHSFHTVVALLLGCYMSPTMAGTCVHTTT